MRVEAPLRIGSLSLIWLIALAAGGAVAQDNEEVFQPGTKHTCVPTADRKGWDCGPASQPPAKKKATASTAEAALSKPEDEHTSTSEPASNVPTSSPAPTRSSDVPSYLLAAPQDSASATHSSESAPLSSEGTTSVSPLPETRAERKAREAREKQAANERAAREKQEQEARAAEDRRLANERKAQEKQERENRAAEDRRLADERKAQEKRERAERDAAERKAAEDRKVAEREAEQARQLEERQARQERRPQPLKEVPQAQSEAAAEPVAAPPPADPAPVEASATPASAPASFAPPPAPPVPAPTTTRAVALSVADFAALNANAYVLELAHGTDKASVEGALDGLALTAGRFYSLRLHEAYVLAWGPFDTLESARAARNEAAAAGVSGVGFPRRVGPMQEEVRRTGSGN